MSKLLAGSLVMRSLAAVAVTAAVAAVACSTAPESSTASLDVAANAAAAAHNHAGPTVAVTPGHYRVAEQVKEKLAAFEDRDAARAAGYTAQFPAGCADSKTPAGAQGFHYLNESLVDNHVEVMKPELVMYEPQADGSMQLVGVDYIIPFDQWKSPQAPMLLGVPMNRNEPLKVWALHIWAQRSNPSGLFAPWNPTVSCQYEKLVTP
jgi:hypothetical protein